MIDIDFISILTKWIPFFATLFFFFIISTILKKTIFAKNKYMFLDDKPLIFGLVILSIVIVFTVSIILSLPINSSTRGQLLSLVGIIFAASISLSSTSLLGNVMAGLMLKVVKSFKTGDFIEVEDVFGKVSELRLLHTEIQTESRDLLTIPNMFLVNKPVKVVKESGTIVSANISLGYDVPRDKIEIILCESAIAAGFTEPFVHICKLDDYSIHYKLSAFLENTKYLISGKSKLRGAMLDGLHKEKIEIVSPSFMNQRQVNDEIFIPKKSVLTSTLDDTKGSPENIMFEKADSAESNEKIKEKIDELNLQLKTIQSEKAKDDNAKDIKAKKITSFEKKLDFLTNLLNNRKEKEEK